MKRNCPGCGIEKIYKSKGGFDQAIKNNSFCQKCANKWDRVFGKEKADEMRLHYSQNNLGKTASDETKQKIAISMQLHWLENSYPETARQKLRVRELKPCSEETREKLRQYTGERNTTVQKILKDRDITYDEYLETIPLWKQYYNTVQRITKQQPIYLLENYEKRGRAKKGTDVYHLDHIISIKFGFDTNIDPNIIGNISNLRVIPWLENLKKSSKLLE
jgi:hypothetical protein